MPRHLYQVPAGTTLTTNIVPITAPVDGFLTITNTLHFQPMKIPPTEKSCFSVWLEFDDEEIPRKSAGYNSCIGENDLDASRDLALNATVPVSAGEHKITMKAQKSGGGPSDCFCVAHNLTVIFFPDNGRSGIKCTIWC
jgi:hypothetical protein